MHIGLQSTAQGRLVTGSCTAPSPPSSSLPRHQRNGFCCWRQNF